MYVPALYQRGNPLLKHIRNVPYEYGEVVPDYVMGATTCAVFLSLRYHRLNPQYVHDRLKMLGQQYQLRVLLLQVGRQYQLRVLFMQVGWQYHLQVGRQYKLHVL